MNFFRFLFAVLFLTFQVTSAVSAGVGDEEQAAARFGALKTMNNNEEPNMPMLRSGAGGQGSRQLGVIEDLLTAIGNFLQAILDIFFG